MVVLGLCLGDIAPGLAKAPLRERLQIPAIGLDLPVVVARFSRGTWNFSRITRQAAYLAMRLLPGQGNNVVIAAHYELANRRPGPFYRLSEVRVNDETIVTHNSVQYRYAVQSIYSVDPADLAPLHYTDSEVLTLITCDDFNAKTRTYDRRLIVRAVPLP